MEMPSRSDGFAPTLSSPGRMAICCIKTLWVDILMPAFVRVTPGSGAVCPAIVMNGEDTVISRESLMTPPTEKMQVRGPRASAHARRLPLPRSERLVTLKIVVRGMLRCRPLPATVKVPNPVRFGTMGGRGLAYAGDDRTRRARSWKSVVRHLGDCQARERQRKARTWIILPL